jgi:hypothetical protein
LDRRACHAPIPRRKLFLQAELLVHRANLIWESIGLPTIHFHVYGGNPAEAISVHESVLVPVPVPVPKDVPVPDSVHVPVPVPVFVHYFSGGTFGWQWTDSR